MNAGIVIPVHILETDLSAINRIKNLVKFLSSWHNLSKVWVIGTIPKIAMELIEKFKKVEVINLINDSVPEMARNKGIQKSLENNTDLTIFMDDDVLAPSINQLDEGTPKAMALSGKVSPKFKASGNTCFDIFHDLDGTLNGVYLSKDNKNALL